MWDRLWKILTYQALRTTDDRGRDVPLCLTPTDDEFPKLPWWRTSEMVRQLGEPWKTELRFQRHSKLSGHLAWMVVLGGTWLSIRMFWPGVTDFGHYLIAFLIAFPAASFAHVWLEYCARSQGTAELKRVYLGAGRCVSCRTPLAGSPGEDGCTACGCGAAWKLADELRRDLPPQPVGLFPDTATAREQRGECRRCGYSRRGIPDDALCPECGAMKNGWVIPPEETPEGRPVCARCKTSMEGRERGRICPECGVMNGIHWVVDQPSSVPPD
jgi:hypothetical protein